MQLHDLSDVLTAEGASGTVHDVWMVPHQSAQGPQSGLGALLRHADI